MMTLPDRHDVALTRRAKRRQNGIVATIAPDQ
jgi:hypothetical protein